MCQYSVSKELYFFTAEERTISLEYKLIIKHQTQVLVVFPPLKYHYFLSEIMREVAVAVPF